VSEFLPTSLPFLSEPRLLITVAMLIVAVVFGALAQYTHFCLLGELQDTVDGTGRYRIAAFGAIALTQALALAGSGYLDLRSKLYFTAVAAFPAVAISGFLFGVGAAITRGCAGRLSVLCATGNLRLIVSTLPKMISERHVTGFIVSTAVPKKGAGPC
jgi:hypothetical protein